MWLSLKTGMEVDGEARILIFWYLTFSVCFKKWSSHNATRQFHSLTTLLNNFSIIGMKIKYKCLFYDNYLTVLIIYYVVFFMSEKSRVQ